MSARLFIVILSYNHPELTARAVESVLPFGLPTLLVHNGTRAEGVAALREEFGQIEHLVLETNRGYSGGANAGMSEAFSRGAERVLFLTNDCRLRGVGGLTDEGVSLVVVPRIEIRGTGRVDSLGGRLTPGLGRLRHCRTREDWERGAGLRYVPGTAFAIDRAVWERVGGFDEALGTYWEDVDWSRRVDCAGFEMRLDEGFCVHHQVGRTCHKDSDYSVYFFQRNRKKIAWKYARAHERVLLGPALAIHWLRLGGRLLRRGRYGDGLKLARAIWD